MRSLFVRQDRSANANATAGRQSVSVIIAVAACLSLFGGCGNRKNAVSGTIEVDEVHVGPRAPGRVEKIFAQEGDRLRAGQPIVELDAARLNARRDVARGA